VGAQPARLPADLSEKVGQETGLLLISVEPGSPAAEAGLMLGDVIVGMDGQSTRHMPDLLGLLSGDRVGSSVAVRVVRAGKIEERKIKVGENLGVNVGDSRSVSRESRGPCRESAQKLVPSGTVTVGAGAGAIWHRMA
jgi:predicted metalloprotease with PDZ domain